MEKTATIGGLPGSGKTTFLAAMWHLITEKEIDTRLRFQNLRSGDQAYLNSIAAQWRNARVQERTAVTGPRLISMNLLRNEHPGDALRLSIPDVPGEEYQRMWEDRDCDASFGDHVGNGGLIFFVHSDNIRQPQWVVDEVALSQQLGLPISSNEVVPWHPRLAPTQVQVIGLLQSLREPPIDRGPRKLALMLSAWDKAKGEGLSPPQYVSEKMPMLSQYLHGNADDWDLRIYGVSAQGADYDPIDDAKPRVASAEEMRQKDIPSHRINLVGEAYESHDLTEPVEWAMG